MIYYKVTLDDIPIDALTALDYCKYSTRSRMVLRCGAGDRPEGIISARTGLYYHVDGWPEFPEDVATQSGGTVVLTEVEPEIYTALVAALDSGSDYEDPDPEYPADATLEYVRAAKKEALNKACNETIVAGFSIELSDGKTYDFDLTLENQSNLLGLLIQVVAGATECDYYASDGTCLTLSAADMAALSNYATLFKSYHIAYYHCLTAWVNALENIPEVAAIVYGAVVPEAYRSTYLIKYATALGVSDYAESD